jgi:hypothetical protein
MNTMMYKGYIGSIEVSEEDNCLYGKVLDLPDNTLISYEGETVAELRDDFHTSVDDYLVHCAEQHIEPHKSYSGNLNVRLSPDVHSRVAALARQAGISINAFIRRAVENQIAALL